MSKKTVFRVIGIFRIEDHMKVATAAAKYLKAGKYNRFMMGARKQDRKKNLSYNELKVQRIQIDFPDLEIAKECREELSPFFQLDKSDF